MDINKLMLQLEVENQPEYRHVERHLIINDQWIQGNQLEEYGITGHKVIDHKVVLKFLQLYS